MNIESELRAAMAEHVADTAAPPDLMSGVLRRNHRRVVRNRALAGGALAVAAVAAVPFLLAGGGTEPGGDEGAPGRLGAGRSGATSLSAPVDPDQPVAHEPDPDGPVLCGNEAKNANGVGETADKRGTVQSGPAQVGIAGIDTTGLPERLQGMIEPLQFQHADSWGYGGRWRDAQTQVDLMVLCGTSAADTELLNATGTFTSAARQTRIKGGSALSEGRHAAWLIRPGVGVDVQVSSDLDVDRIVAGIRVTG